jgi:hypothetical protein
MRENSKKRCDEAIQCMRTNHHGTIIDIALFSLLISDVIKYHFYYGLHAMKCSLSFSLILVIEDRAIPSF